MDLSYTIDERRQLVIIRGDYADAAEWRRVLTALLNDPNRPVECVILRDQSAGTRPVDPATVVAIMEVVREFWPALGVKRAAVLMPRDFDAPALIAEALAGEAELPIRAFRSYAGALEWLASPLVIGSVRRSGLVRPT